MSFGDIIKKIRLAKNLSIRAVALNLKTMDSAKYARIEMGIQNPFNKNEFNDIIKTLGITDKLLIDELETVALKPLDKKKPVLFNENSDMAKRLNKLLKEAYTPN